MLLILSALIFSLRGCVAHNGSTQTPSTMVGGQQVSLTCTAPGLCSGSHPNIVCTYTLSALCDFDISFNISATNSCTKDKRTVNVTSLPKNDSKCTNWLLTASDYSVNTVVSTDNISFTVAVKDSDLSEKLLQVLKQPEVIAAFVAGILFSAPFCCLCRKCHRKKRKSSEYMVERLEMVTTQSAQNDGCRDGQAAEGGAQSAGQPPREVEYSDIDFSRWDRTAGTVDAPKATDTEYAEIQKEKKEDGPEKEGEYSEILERNEEVLPLTEEAEETNPCVFVQKQEVEEVAEYSGVN